MSATHDEYHLILDQDRQGRRPGGNGQGKAPRPACLIVQPGPSFLAEGDGGSPRLLQGLDAPADAPFIEPVQQGRRTGLALVRPADVEASINGQPAARFALLDDGDRLQVNGWRLEVALYHRPRIQPAGEEFAGRTCPVCHAAFGPTARVYICPCGAVMHCDADEGEENFNCAQAGTVCASCQTPIELAEGYLRARAVVPAQAADEEVNG